MKHAHYRTEITPAPPRSFDPVRDWLDKGQKIVLWPGPDRRCYWCEVIRFQPTTPCDVLVHEPVIDDHLETIHLARIMSVVTPEVFSRAVRAGYPSDITTVVALLSQGGVA